jgi:hypothetical protein
MSLNLAFGRMSMAHLLQQRADSLRKEAQSSFADFTLSKLSPPYATVNGTKLRFQDQHVLCGFMSVNPQKRLVPNTDTVSSHFLLKVIVVLSILFPLIRESPQWNGRFE